MLAPWRWLALLHHLSEPVKRWPLRQALAHHWFLHDEQRHADAQLDRLETVLSLRARGDERAYPITEPSGQCAAGMGGGGAGRSDAGN